MFKRNAGVLDRMVRVVIGVVFLPVGFFLLGKPRGSFPGVLAAGLGSFGLATGLTGVSVLYDLFGISTVEKEKERMGRCASMVAGSGGELSCAGHGCCPFPHPVEKTENQAE